MQEVVIPESYRSYVNHPALLMEWLSRGYGRTSAAVVTWAVVLLDDPAISIARLAQLISVDPRLSSRALFFANTPRTTTEGVTTTVDEALMRLGLRHVRGFMLAETLPFLHSAEDDPQRREHQELMWKQGVQRAILAKEIAKASRIANADEMYTCALLVSGILQIQDSLSPAMRARIEEAALEELSFLSVVLGTLESWPEEWIQAAIEQSRHYDRRKRSKIGQTISLASACIDAIAEESPFVLEAHPQIIKAAKPLEITESNVQRVLSSSRKAIKDTFKRFGL